MRLDLIRTHLLEFINKGFPARQLRRLAARDLLDPLAPSDLTMYT